MDSIPRRQALKTLGAAGAGALIGVTQGDAAGAADAPIVVAGTPVQVVIEPVSRETARISLIPAAGAGAATIPPDGSLVKPSWSKPVARIGTLSSAEQRVSAGGLTVVVSFSANEPPGGVNASTGAGGVASSGERALVIRVDAADGRTVQTLRVDAASGAVTFPLGDGPVLGFGPSKTVSMP